MDHGYVKQQPPLKKKGNSNFCCVPQCLNYLSPTISLHLFPKNASLKTKWETVLRMGKPASHAMRVCSNHFLKSDYFPSAGSKSNRLFPHAVPSQNIPKRSHDNATTSQRSGANEARSQRAERRQQGTCRQLREIENPAEDSAQIGMQDTTQDPGQDQETIPICLYSVASTQVNLADDRRLCQQHEGRSLADIISDMSGSTEKACQVNLQGPILPGSLQHESDKQNICLPDLLTSNVRLFTFTGIHTLDLLEGLVTCVSHLIEEEPTNKKILPARDRIILTMSKLKLNISFSALGVLFGISRQTCSNYFKNMCPRLSRVLKVMIPFPDTELLRNNLPLSFDKYRFTRIILDCAETTMEKCKCLKCRILTYSQYKKNHTAKFDVGTSPSGLITEMSDAYGGRASDKFIVNNSGVLEKLDYQDGVMVDKGFRIEKECEERYLRLIRPPFLTKKKQLNQEDALETADIARARVHIERVIQRLRQFKFLHGPVPWHFAPYFDDVLKIAAGLTNLGPSVINIDKFM